MAEEEIKIEDGNILDDALELTEVEQEAFKEGWRPEADFGGEKNKWIPADEFMRRKPLFSKIDELKSDNYHTRKELQEVKKTLTQLSSHHKQVRETEYARAIKELQTARKNAMEDRDHDAVVNLEEEIDKVKDQKREFDTQLKQEQQQNVQPTPEYTEWVKDNPWYLQDQEMHDDADGFAVAYVNSHRSAPPDDVYKAVNAKMKRAYPEKFGDKKVTEPVSKPSPVDSGRTSAPRAPTKGRVVLTAMQEEICKNFVKQNLMTREEYIAELSKIEE